MQSKAPPRQTEQKSQGARPKRGLGSWIRRGLVWLVAGLLALAVIGAIYQVVATQIDQSTYPPPGEMVNVNGHLMHINCMGEGGPTVILEAANLGMSAHWVRVQQQLAQQLAKTTRVCAGARPFRNPETPSRSPANCIPYSRAQTLKVPTCWWVIPTAGCTRGCTPPGTPSRLRAWSWSTPLTPSSSRVLKKGGQCMKKTGGWVLSFLG